ncbi:MAG: hypothetical protein CMJ32_10345 [Phycisphaerae bacterium]|nr:hypothetical protein [Phycisphaerae bacterium]
MNMNRNEDVEVVEIRVGEDHRLHVTGKGHHLSHDEIYAMVSSGTRIRVLDQDEQDITSSILARILLEKDPLRFSRIPSWLLHDLIRGNEHVLQRVLDGVGLAVDSVLKKAEHGLGGDSESDAAPRPLDAIAGAIGRLRSDAQEDRD